jgi:hypothetical protein
MLLLQEELTSQDDPDALDFEYLQTMMTRITLATIWNLWRWYGMEIGVHDDMNLICFLLLVTEEM